MTYNPFIHGIDGTTINRQLLIKPLDGEPAVFRSLSEKQKDFPDHFILGCDCRFYADYAEVIQGQNYADDDSDFSVGEVIQVLYSIEGKCGAENIHMGDHYCAGDAQNAIDKIAFDRNQIERCWEISTAHISRQANDWLLDQADMAGLGLYFYVARMVDVFVIKIIGAPWEDANLMNIEGITASALRDDQKEKGVPESLIDLLHLAAQAKVRFLVLDPDANELENLPVYDW